jgi:integrase/recombinase XerC
MDRRNCTELAKRQPTTALEALKDWRNDAERKRRMAEAIRDGDRETMWSCFQAYVIATHRKPRVSGSTFRSYHRAMEDLLDWTEAGEAEGRMIHQITPTDANLFRGYLQESGARGGQPLAPASVNARLAGVRKLMACLMWAGLRDGDPFARLGLDDRQPEEKRYPFDATEVASLLAAAVDPRDRALLLLGADVGLRLAEVAGLVWGAVNLGGRMAFILGKGDRIRTVVFTERAAEALANLPGDRADDAPVVGLSARSIQHRFANLCEAAGVRQEMTVARLVADADGRATEERATVHRGFHSLRHSCATRLHEANTPIEVIGRILGHLHIETTRIYEKLDLSDLRAAAERLDAADRGNRPRAAA